MTSDPSESPWIYATEACALLRVSKHTLLRHVAAGYIRTVRPSSRRTLYSRADCANLMNALYRTQQGDKAYFCLKKTLYIK